MNNIINSPPEHNTHNEEIPEKTIEIEIFDKERKINVFTEENGTSEHFFHKNPNLDLNAKIMIALANELDYEPHELLNLDWDKIDGWELLNIKQRVFSQD